MLALLGLVAFVFIGNAMATPEQRAESRAFADRLGRLVAIPTILFWVMVLFWR